jgi:hypothetical protein
MTEVSPDGGESRQARASAAASPRAVGAADELVGTTGRQEGGELGMHEVFLSIAGT